jgi:hypothetical protein
MSIKTIGVLILFLLKEISAKKFAPCELAAELYAVHNFSLNEAKNLLCIAQKLSGLNTNVIGGEQYGIFQINRAFCTQG